MNFIRNERFAIRSVLHVYNRHFSTENLTKLSYINGVQTITMSHNKTRNSLSLAMMQNLIDDIKRYENDINLRAIVLSGDGNIFSAGHNLKELTSESGRQQHKAVFKLASELMKSIIDSPVPVIAKVDGLAAAAGCQLVAQCDLAICSDRSKFSTPGANFGVFCSTPGIAIARCVHKMAALHMLFTGLPITAMEAKDIGLVSKVCSPDTLDDELETTIEAIRKKSRSIVELGKKFYYKQVQMDIRTAYDMGTDKMVDNVNLNDGQEGIRSFVEKRKPHWSHS